MAFTPEDKVLISEMTKKSNCYWFDEGDYIVYPSGEKIFRAIGLYFLVFEDEISKHLTLQEALDN